MKEIAQNGILIALALSLSLIERWFPLNLLVPLPGIKLGLANIVTLFALFYLGFKQALTVVVLRCLLGAMFYGGVIAFLLSLAGSLLALAVMTLLIPGAGKWFTIIGISIGGAAAHNTGQVAMAALLLQNPSVFAYLTLLLAAGIITGILTGTAATMLFNKIDKTGGLQGYFPAIQEDLK